MRRAESRRSRRAGAGFSLLEMLVAISILALALGALYRAAGGATRNVQADERYAYAVELARSLLAANARVPADGVSARGETAGGFVWRVETAGIDLDRTALSGARLFHIEVGVGWNDAGRQREVVLDSVVEGLYE